MTFSSDVLPQSKKQVLPMSDKGSAELFKTISELQNEYGGQSSRSTVTVPSNFETDANFEESKTYPREADGLLHKNRHHATVQEAGRTREQRFILLDGCVRDQKSAPLNQQEWYDYITDWREKNVFDCHSAAQDEKVWSMAQWAMNLPGPTWLTFNIKVTPEGLAQYQAAQPQQAAAQPTQPIDPSTWRSLFRTIGEMEDGPIDMIIDGVLQEGTCFLGALPSSGKTLVSLAFAKAICTGEPLFNLTQYSVQKPRTVIYLIPESRDRAFRKRCEVFRLPDDATKFLTRTISAGVPLELSDPRLLEAVRQTKGVVFLDTASRFMRTNDENSAAQNRMLVNDVIALLSAGAVCVVLVHHATKDSKKDDLNLENALRGTSDFGAMCDQAYGIRKDEKKYKNGAGPLEIELISLKDREQIGGLTSIRLAATWKEEKRADGIHQVTFPVSYINTTGNFRVVSETEAANKQRHDLETLVAAEPNMSAKELATALRTGEYGIKNELQRLGYHRVKGGPDGASPWHKDVEGKCPYEKPDVVEITLPEATKKLTEFLKGTTPNGATIGEPNLLQWADQEGITEAMLTKARKRLGVVVNKRTKNWSLPDPSSRHDTAGF